MSNFYAFLELTYELYLHLVMKGNQIKYPRVKIFHMALLLNQKSSIDFVNAVTFLLHMQVISLAKLYIHTKIIVMAIINPLVLSQEKFLSNSGYALKPK